MGLGLIPTSSKLLYNLSRLILVYLSTKYKIIKILKFSLTNVSAEIKIHFFPILMVFEFDFMINTHATKVEDEPFA